MQQVPRERVVPVYPRGQEEALNPEGRRWRKDGRRGDHVSLCEMNWQLHYQSRSDGQLPGFESEPVLSPSTRTVDEPLNYRLVYFRSLGPREQSSINANDVMSHGSRPHFIFPLRETCGILVSAFGGAAPRRGHAVSATVPRRCLAFTQEGLTMRFLPRLTNKETP